MIELLLSRMNSENKFYIWYVYFKKKGERYNFHSYLILYHMPILIFQRKMLIFRKNKAKNKVKNSLWWYKEIFISLPFGSKSLDMHAYSEQSYIWHIWNSNKRRSSQYDITLTLGCKGGETSCSKWLWKVIFRMFKL